MRKSAEIEGNGLEDGLGEGEGKETLKGDWPRRSAAILSIFACIGDQYVQNVGEEAKAKIFVVNGPILPA